MSKIKIEPPPPQLASAEDRRLAAETILKGWVAAKGQAWLCCDIPVGSAAVLLARHEMAMLPACEFCGYQGEPTDTDGDSVCCAGCGEWSGEPKADEPTIQSRLVFE